MKYLKKTLFALLLIIGVVSSKAQTTSEEYNFVTKGYKIQLDGGLDMKKGYTLKNLGEYPLIYNQDGKRECKLKGLYRDADMTKPCAIMMIYSRESSGYLEYYCIPTPDAEKALWDRVIEQLNSHLEDKYVKQMYQTMIWALMKFSSQEAGK
jgi:hypothetical protein